jgi:phage terminase small subunit
MAGAPPRLTPKEERFVEEYLVDLNGTAAYRRAFPKAGPATARTNASQLLAKANVRAAVRKRRQQVEQRTKVTAERVVRELARLAFADLGDVADLSDPDQPRLKRHIPPDARRALQEVSRTQHGVKIKLADKQAALDKLMRHLGLYQDLPPLEVLLGLLPPELAGPLRETLARSLPPGAGAGGAPGHGPEPGGPAGGPGAVLHGGGPDPGPVAESVPGGPVEAADAPVLPPGGQELRGGGEDAGPLFDDG